MEKINRFQGVDIILEYIDRPEHHNQMFDAEKIKKELFPNDHVDTVQFLFEFIDNCGINNTTHTQLYQYGADAVYPVHSTKILIRQGRNSPNNKKVLL